MCVRLWVGLYLFTYICDLILLLTFGSSPPVSYHAHGWKFSQWPPFKIRLMVTFKLILSNWLPNSSAGVPLSFLFLSVFFCLHFFLSILLSFSLLLPQIDPCPQPLPLLYCILENSEAPLTSGEAVFRLRCQKERQKKAPQFEHSGLNGICRADAAWGWVGETFSLVREAGVIMQTLLWVRAHNAWCWMEIWHRLWIGLKETLCMSHTLQDRAHSKDTLPIHSSCSLTLTNHFLTGAQLKGRRGPQELQGPLHSWGRVRERVSV